MPLLFSYGTLQKQDVQFSTFGRLLAGQPDELVGFEQSLLRITDPVFVATSGKAHHAIVKFNGRSDSRVAGMVFEVSESELTDADQYEPAGYQRISAMLASGKQAWVYADASRESSGMTTMTAPDQTEAAEYYFTYIKQVGGGDICRILEDQASEIPAALQRISDDRSLHRYGPDKWSIREVVSHINDTERVFAFRAFWFARGFDSPLPSFDQDTAVASAAPDARAWQSHVNEFRAVRSATLSLFKHLPDEGWLRRGTASGNPFSVRALAYIAAGHAAHHMRILKERYS